jgi:hypothetical protein
MALVVEFTFIWWRREAGATNHPQASGAPTNKSPPVVRLVEGTKGPQGLVPGGPVPQLARVRQDHQAAGLQDPRPLLGGGDARLVWF